MIKNAMQWKHEGGGLPIKQTYKQQEIHLIHDMAHLQVCLFALISECWTALDSLIVLWSEFQSSDKVITKW